MTAPTARPGYADVNGLHLYFEEYGDPSASPVVLLHGGMLTIDLSWAGLIPALTARHRVIAVEAQGHGRTADIDRPITPANNAADVLALLDHLGIERAHVVGHSMGAATALELAVNHPDRLRSVVPVSGSVRPDGLHPDLGSPEAMATSERMPTQQDFADFHDVYLRLSPHPEHFDDFLAAQSANDADLKGWTDEQLAGITTPVLVVLGDRDFTTAAHGALMLELIPGAQLAILPGTTHMQAPRRTALLEPLLAGFLD